MRVLFINSVCGIRSTGRIVADLAEKLIASGDECKIAYGREKAPAKYESISYRIGTDHNVKINALKARTFDNEGFGAKKETKEFIKFANDYNPDLLWIHNLHGYYINIELLFDWIKSRPQMQVKWTLHDCWAFTGHCAYFSMASCKKWKTQCEKCSQKREYPSSYIRDNSANNYNRKRKAFTGVKNMTLITPSKWLADLVEESFLREYMVEVHYNTIDTSVFKPTPSNFREKHGLEDKIIILGVASVWDKRKGLQDFIRLDGILDDSYSIVLVGVNEKQKKKLSKRILAISRTNNAKELAEIYTAADLLLSLSKEETFGLTVLEALSCNTYPIVYKNTACEEIVGRYGGMAVEQDVDSVLDAVYKATAQLNIKK